MSSAPQTAVSSETTPSSSSAVIASPAGPHPSFAAATPPASAAAASRSSHHRDRQRVISALQLKLSCGEERCTRRELVHCAAYFTPRHYENVVVERATSQRICGYPLCRRTLDSEKASGQLRAKLLMRQLKRMTGEKMLFCSKTCTASSRAFLAELRADVPAGGVTAAAAGLTAAVLAVVNANPPFGGYEEADSDDDDDDDDADAAAARAASAASLAASAAAAAPPPLPSQPASASLKKVHIVERVDVGAPSTDFSSTASPFAVEGYSASTPPALARDRFSAFVLLNAALAGLCTARTSRWLLRLAAAEAGGVAAAEDGYGPAGEAFTADGGEGVSDPTEAQRFRALSSMLGRHSARAGVAVRAEELLRGGQRQLVSMLGAMVRTFELRRGALPSLKGQQWSILTLVLALALVRACRGDAGDASADEALAHAATHATVAMRRCKLSVPDLEALVARCHEVGEDFAGSDGLTLPPPAEAGGGGAHDARERT